MEEKLTNHEILQHWLDNGLLKRCIDCQFYKMGEQEYKEDFFNDICLIILEYDNDKLNDAFNKHPNAWITRVIQNNIFSVNSAFYKTYRKWDNMRYGEITEKELEIDNDTDIWQKRI